MAELLEANPSHLSRTRVEGTVSRGTSLSQRTCTPGCDSRAEFKLQSTLSLHVLTYKPQTNDDKEYSFPILMSIFSNWSFKV